MIINKLNDIINNSQTSDPRYMISSFIKQNILIINSLTIKEVADGSHVSKAMVSKFVKELGYDNFAELKLFDVCRKSWIKGSIFSVR